MSTPAEQVESAFNRAASYAEQARSQMSSFLAALDSSIYTPPTLSVTWESLAAPTLPALPTAPTLPTIEFTAPGGQPAPLALSEPTIEIADFTDSAPTLTLPTAPTVSYGAAPTIPAIGDVTVPSAPTISTPAAPTYLAISTVTTPTIDLREDWLTQLETIPTLNLLEPTPYSYTRGPEYASALLDALKAKLAERIGGGSGLSTAVEQAIWDRARDRETRTAQANIDQIARSSEALGFQLPTGALAQQLREAEKNYFDKLSDLSREVALKQADLEQQNLRETITAGIQLEGQLVEYSWKMEQMAFETAKAYAQNAIDLHNAAVDQFRALLQGYETYASAYKTIIDGELGKVEIYKAQLQGEETKAQVNTALVQQYKAQIDAGMAQVDIYRAQVSAAQTLVQLEQAKIGAAGEQIKAYVAQVNAETAKVEAFKAAVDGEVTKVQAFKAQVDAYSAKVGAQAEKARAQISRYSAMYQAKASEWDGYRAAVAAEGERVRALGLQSSSLVDGYKVVATAAQAQAEQQTSVWRANIAQYEAGQNIAIQTAKINNDAVTSTNATRLDAAKVGAQVYAQLTASAYSMINASASVSAGSSMSVGYSYSNDTSSTVPPVTSA
jgi:hypothetical protein